MIGSTRPPDLCDPEVAARLARRAGVRLQHSLGQHLLVDRQALDCIVEALAPEAGDEVLEVGPGIGTLTVELAARVRRVIAVDLDSACVRATRLAVAGIGEVRVVEGDALVFDLDGMSPGWLAAGNIPYGITGALLEKLMAALRPPRRAVLLVQREVARRLAAAAGEWSLATVALRTVASAERLCDLPPRSFSPPPRVHSSVLRLIPDRSMGEAERGRVLTVARACFQLRRKVMRHGVVRACAGDAVAAGRALEAAGVDPRRRPGELDLDEWRRLAAAVDVPLRP